MSRIVFLWGFIKPHLEREILPNWWRILFSPNAWFMREKSSIITHYLAAPGVGENLHPIYIITSSCPSTLPTIPASRPGFRVHRKKSLREDYTGQGLMVLPPLHVKCRQIFCSYLKSIIASIFKSLFKAFFSKRCIITGMYSTSVAVPRLDTSKNSIQYPNS